MSSVLLPLVLVSLGQCQAGVCVETEKPGCATAVVVKVEGGCHADAVASCNVTRAGPLRRVVARVRSRQHRVVVRVRSWRPFSRLRCCRS